MRPGRTWPVPAVPARGEPVLVAEGVRSLAAAVPESAVPEAASESAVPGAAPPVRPAVPAHPQRAAWRGPAGPWRSALLVAGAAPQRRSSSSSGRRGERARAPAGRRLKGTSAETVFTAVSRCTALEQASGTLERVNGSSLVVDGQRPAGDRDHDGLNAIQRDRSAAGSRHGRSVSDPVGSKLRRDDRSLPVMIADPAQQHPQPPPDIVVVKGTVSDASTAGFTVVTTDGSRVPVDHLWRYARQRARRQPRPVPGRCHRRRRWLCRTGRTLSARGVVAILKLPQPTSPAIGPLPPGQAGQGQPELAYAGAIYR